MLGILGGGVEIVLHHVITGIIVSERALLTVIFFAIVLSDGR